MIISKNLKVYITGIALILSGISGCTYNILSEKTTPSEAISNGVVDIQKGVNIISETK